MADRLILLWRFVKGLALTLLILLALVNLAARIAMTQLDRFKPELALLFEGIGIQGLELDRMSGDWHGWRPRFRFEGVRLQLPDEALPSIDIRELELTVKPFRSLIEGRLSLADFRAGIEQVELQRTADRRWAFNGRTLGSDAAAAVRPSLELKRFLSHLPDRVSVAVTRITLKDAAEAEPLLIRDLQLKSQRWRGGRRLQLHAVLPQDLGGAFSLRLAGDWQEQRLYLETGEVDLMRLQRLLPRSWPLLQSARVKLRSWVEFDTFRLMRVQSLAEVADLRLRRDATSRDSTDALQFRVRQLLMREPQGWRNDLQLHALRRGKAHLPPVASQQYWADGAAEVLLWLDGLDLASVGGWVRPLLDGQAATWLANSHPRGRFEDLLLAYRIDQPDASLWHLALNAVGFERVQRLPGMRNLSLTLDGRGRHARGRLASRDLWLDFGDLFRDPLHASVVDADVRLSLLSDQFLLDVPDFALSNADAALEGRLRLETQPGARPFLSLRATASRGNASATGRYLPTRIMPPATVRWLDEAILGGELRRAEVLYHGRTRSLKQLVPKQAAEFMARIRIERPRLRYRAGWPMVTRGQGDLVFHNLSMTGHFSAVDFGRAEARSLDLRIDNLANARLLLNVKADNDAGALLGSLAGVEELPLFQRIHEPTEVLRGPVNLDLSLEIPLSRKQKRRLSVEAALDFRDVVWRAPAWLVDVTRLQGGLVLKNRALRGRKLKARYAGDPVSISLAGDLDAGRTDIGISGRIQSRRLLGLMPPELATVVDGRSDWNIDLGLQRVSQGGGFEMDISARSDLEGTALTLPEPLALAADERLPVHFSGHLTPRQYLDFRLDLSPKMLFEGRYDSIAEGKGLAKIEYLNLLLGEGALPEGDAGLRLRAAAAQLDLDAWQAWLKQFAGKLDLSGEGVLARAQQLDVQIGRVLWSGYSLEQVSLGLERQGAYLAGPIESSVAQGSLLWPVVSGPDAPIVLDLQHLSWPNADKSIATDWQPKLEQMPNLVLVSQEFRWRDMVFSDLVVRTRNDGRRFDVQRLDLRKDEVLLRATGNWQHQALGGDDITVFNIAIKGKHFGQVVEKLGLGAQLSGGTIDFFGQIGWGGAIDDINWETLIGEVDLTLKDGYLRNVDPGAGRFVGLLSFSALPRRLFLDFGDVLSKGLQFRKIRGKFSIQGEILSTDNAWMDSSSAEVRIKGITNLRTKTYDQTMYIIPKVGDTLPVIGALTGGSTLGWGILLLQKIFKKPIDKSVEIQYRVTGPWDEPKIELIKKPDAKKPTTNDEPFADQPNS